MLLTLALLVSPTTWRVGTACSRSREAVLRTGRGGFTFTRENLADAARDRLQSRNEESKASLIELGVALRLHLKLPIVRAKMVRVGDLEGVNHKELGIASKVRIQERSRATGAIQIALPMEQAEAQPLIRPTFVADLSDTASILSPAPKQREPQPDFDGIAISRPRAPLRRKKFMGVVKSRRAER